LGQGDGNGKGGESIESFKYCFLTRCILTGVHPSPLDRLFEKKNGGAKGRKEGKSRRWEIHSEDVYAQYCRVK